MLYLRAHCLCCFLLSTTLVALGLLLQACLQYFHSLLEKFGCENRNSSYWNLGEESKYCCAVLLPVAFLQISSSPSILQVVIVPLYVLFQNCPKGGNHLLSAFLCIKSLLEEQNKADSIFIILL